MAGVAPGVTLVNDRAGQDSGFFFLWETVSALKYAGDIGADVANMSFYTDPWQFNCTNDHPATDPLTDARGRGGQLPQQPGRDEDRRHEPRLSAREREGPRGHRLVPRHADGG
jgi:hypothetical protein